MEFIRVSKGQMADLKSLQIGYKSEIGESTPTDENFDSLFSAIIKGQILF